jgi:hypothetical protein
MVFICAPGCGAGVDVEPSRQPATVGSSVWVQAFALDSSHTHASASQPVGTYFASVATLPGDPESYLYGFGGIQKGWVHSVLDQGWRLSRDSSTWSTDYDAGYLDIPPAQGRAGYGLVPLPNGGDATQLLAVGGRDSRAPGGVPYGNVDTADVFTPDVGWSQLATLPNPSLEAVGRWCSGTACDSSCTPGPRCAVATAAIIDPLQTDGSQLTIHGTVGNPRYALVVGGLLGSEHQLPNPSGRSWGGQQFITNTNNAIFYNHADGRFHDVPMAPVTYPVPGNCVADSDCENNKQRCVDGECSPSSTYEAGSVPSCVMLGNTGTAILGGRDQTVCCGGRTSFGWEWGFPYANTCQIFTPDFATPENSTWQLCAAWEGVPGEDDNPAAEPYTHGRAELSIAVTSDYKVLMLGGKVRMKDNFTGGSSRRIRVLDPALCGSGHEYTLLETTLLQPRESAPVVALGGDTFLLIGGNQGTNPSLDGNGLDNYQTERIVWDPARDDVRPGYPRCDANLPSQVVNGVRLPYNSSFASQAILLANGHVAYYAGSEATAQVGSAHMVTIWEPGESECP